MAAPIYSRKNSDYIFLRDRHRAFSRSKCQAEFRGEVWELTLKDWTDFWTEQRWPLRGRHNESLMMTRFDDELPWTRKNCCLINRLQGAQIRNWRRAGRNIQGMFQGCITI